LGNQTNPAPKERGVIGILVFPAKNSPGIKDINHQLSGQKDPAPHGAPSYRQRQSSVHLEV